MRATGIEVPAVTRLFGGLVAVLFGGLVAGCGGSDGAPADAADGVPDASCQRAPAAADRPRHVVVAHPYDGTGQRSQLFEVLSLSTTGELARPQRTFSLAHHASFGTIEFTPDGEIGLVALENGTLGVFRIDAAGDVTVIEAGLAGSFYASRVVVDPRGDRAWVIDGNTRDNGGGLYEVAIDCDGTVTDRGLVAGANLPGAMAFVGDRAVIAARGLAAGTTPGHDVHLVRGGGFEPVAGVDAFGDDAAIIGGAALTADGATFLVGDTSGFSGVPNRIAVVGVSDTALVAASVITPLEDPEAIATSPFGDVAVVTSAFGDAIFVLDTGGAGGAWRIRGEVSYVGGAPMLPGDLATISSGALRGHVFVAENVSVRHLAFRDTGAVDDLGSLAFGSGLQNISGAIGVTP